MDAPARSNPGRGHGDQQENGGSSVRSHPILHLPTLRHFQLDGAQCDPKPVQQPHPQILIGGGGEQLTLRVAARLADASNFGGKPHEFKAKTEVLKQHCADVGRDYDDIQKTWSPEIFIRETDTVRLFGEKVIPALR